MCLRQYKNKSRLCFVLPKPQGDIRVSIKEVESARFLFLANEADSERRYPPKRTAVRKMPLKNTDRKIFVGLRFANPTYELLFLTSAPDRDNTKKSCFVLPKPQGHIGVSIKEGARACSLFLANAPDSERRYRPEAHGSAQKAFLIKSQRANFQKAFLPQSHKATKKKGRQKPPPFFNFKPVGCL